MIRCRCGHLREEEHDWLGHCVICNCGREKIKDLTHQDVNKFINLLKEKGKNVNT